MNGTSASAASPGPPRSERLDVGGGDDPAAGVTEHVLEQDLERDRGAIEVDPLGDGGQAPDVGQTGPEAGPGAEGIGMGHASSVMLDRYTRSDGRVPRVRFATRPPGGPTARGSAGVNGPGAVVMKAWGDPGREAARDRRDETLKAIDEAGIDLAPASPAEVAAAAFGPDHDAHAHSHPHVQSQPGEPPVIGIVGAGSVGSALGVALDRAGWRIHAVASRSAERRDRFRELVPGRARVRRCRRRSSRRSS